MLKRGTVYLVPRDPGASGLPRERVGPCGEVDEHALESWWKLARERRTNVLFLDGPPAQIVKFARNKHERATFLHEALMASYPRTHCYRVVDVRVATERRPIVVVSEFLYPWRVDGVDVRDLEALFANHARRAVRDGELRGLLRQALQFLADAQARLPGFRHNDLHGRNCLLTGEGLRVIDLGLAGSDAHPNPLVLAAERAGFGAPFEEHGQFGIQAAACDFYDWHTLFASVLYYAVKYGLQGTVALANFLAFLDFCVGDASEWFAGAAELLGRAPRRRFFGPAGRLTREAQARALPAPAALLSSRYMNP